MSGFSVSWRYGESLFYGKLMRGLVRLLWKTDGWAHATGQMASWREWDTSSSRSLDELGATLSDVSWRRLAIAPRMNKWLDKLMCRFQTSLMADGWKSGKWWLMQAKTLYNMGKIAIWHRQIPPLPLFFRKKNCKLRSISDLAKIELEKGQHLSFKNKRSRRFTTPGPHIVNKSKYKVFGCFYLNHSLPTTNP